MEWLGDPEVSFVALMGPAQAGKTEVMLNWLGWLINTEPSNTIIVQPSQKLAQTFVETRVEPMIEATQSVKNKLMPVANANNIGLKKFRGMFLETVWPVASNFVQRPFRYAIVDDFAQMPTNVGESGGEGGQGSVLGLIDGRQTTFLGREKTFVASSPADDGGGDIAAEVASGCDARLNPICPSCGDRWEIDTERDLRFDETGDLDEAEETAHVVCATNGCILPPSSRRQMLLSLGDLPDYGFVIANPSASRRRRSARIDGLLTMTPWPELARKKREAQLQWQQHQDESGLRAFTNTKAGKNYRSKQLGDKLLDAADLHRLKTLGWKMGTMPHGPSVWTMAVDIQADRFEVIAEGHGADGETWTIERFAVEVLEDGVSSLRPFLKPEHWRVLLPLFERQYPMIGGGLSPPPICVAFDTGGGGDRDIATATENAKKFWHLARAAGVQRSRIMLLKGSSNPNEKRDVWKASGADVKAKGGVRRDAPEMWLVNSHKHKFVLDARFRRDKPGPGYQHFPEDFEDRWLEEATAEELTAKRRWKKREGRRANETLDLKLYAKFALMKPPFAQSRPHMKWVPSAYRIKVKREVEVNKEDSSAVVTKLQPAAQVATEPNKRASSPFVAAPKTKPVSNWINRRKR
jgi:phage terminase large subunit GpA-like protein